MLTYAELETAVRNMARKVDELDNDMILIRAGDDMYNLCEMDERISMLEGKLPISTAPDRISRVADRVTGLRLVMEKYDDRIKAMEDHWNRIAAEVDEGPDYYLNLLPQLFEVDLPAIDYRLLSVEAMSRVVSRHEERLGALDGGDQPRFDEANPCPMCGKHHMGDCAEAHGGLAGDAPKPGRTSIPSIIPCPLCHGRTVIGYDDDIYTLTCASATCEFIGLSVVGYSVEGVAVKFSNILWESRQQQAPLFADANGAEAR